MSLAMQIPDAKAAVQKKRDKLKIILAWQESKVKRELEVVDKAQTERKTVHVAMFMDLCHLKNSEFDKKFQKLQNVWLRGDVVKDDSCSYAVFTEQGFFASHMTAATVLDVISRLPVCAGQASDAVSA